MCQALLVYPVWNFPWFSSAVWQMPRYDENTGHGQTKFGWRTPFLQNRRGLQPIRPNHPTNSRQPFNQRSFSHLPPKGKRWEIRYPKHNPQYSYRFQYHTLVMSFVGMTKALGLLLHLITLSETHKQTLGTTPLDEGLAYRKDLYLQTHNTHKRQTPM
jgi:hypothetical protein